MTPSGEKLRGAAAPAPLSYFETDAALRGLWAMQSYALFYAAFITALGKLPIHLMSEGEQRAILLLLFRTTYLVHDLDSSMKKTLEKLKKSGDIFAIGLFAELVKHYKKGKH